MLPFVGTKDERTGSVIKQVKINVLLNSVFLYYLILRLIIVAMKIKNYYINFI